MEEAAIQECGISHAAELTVKNVKWLSLLSESQYEEQSDTTGGLQLLLHWKSLQVEDNLVNHLFEVNHFMYRCLKFKKEMKAVIAPYKEGV